MGIQETTTKEVAPNTYAAAIIQKTNNLLLLSIERDNMIDIILEWMAADPNRPIQVASGYIDELANIDSRFDQYRRS